MPPSKSIPRDAFLASLEASGLLDEKKLEDARGTLPETPRGRLVARALVEQGVLTRFQAERLLAGRTSGFHLGQYRILEELGRGGMGRVYKAEHLTMGRIVAIKILAPDLLKTARAEHLFLREVRASAQLAHPNIVTAYDANKINDRFFLVMEFVDGPNFELLVKEQGPLEHGLACDYIRQVCHGLQCAHMLGMVHRDIKPANIMVQRQGLREDLPGLVKISDFGLARLHEPGSEPAYGPAVGTILAKENTVMGTPDYLSPEQARSLHNVDIRADIYSLGCTFYYLLTGSPPFPKGTALEKLIRHTTETPRPIRQFRLDVPREVVDVLNKAMAKHPKDRYQTPTEFAAALETFAVSGPIPWAPPPSTDFEEEVATVTPVAGETPVVVEEPSDDLLPTRLEDKTEPAPEPIAPPRSVWGKFASFLVFLVILAVIGLGIYALYLGGN